MKVIELFKRNLAASQNGPTSHAGDNDLGSVTATTQDILILLLPYLTSADAMALFKLTLTPEVLAGKDSGVQKRAYKILTKLLESKKLTIDPEVVLGKLDEFTDRLAPAAKKVSLLLLLFVLLLISKLRTDSAFWRCSFP